MATGEPVSIDPQAAPVEFVPVLLVCRDRGSQKWGPRWLERFGFAVELVTSADQAERLSGEPREALTIVEAGMRDRDGRPLFASLLRSSSAAERPMLVLCASDREIRLALEAGATDVARRPFDWHLVGRRAARLAASWRSCRELESAREALDRALRHAEEARARQDRQARVDSLTDLPSRRVFRQLVDRAVNAPRRAGALTAVLIVDLDRFGAINESLGRDAGNAVLALVAKRLRSCLQSGDLFAAGAPGLVTAALSRLSGDQFALMAGNMPDDLQVRRFAEAVLRSLAEPFEVNDDPIFLSASCGVACHPNDGDSAAGLLQHAELAMLEAKQRGGGVLQFYDASMNQRARQTVEVDRDLRRAFERGELELHYQPLVNLASGEVVAAEALLRWPHPERGFIPPLEFIPVAEETGLMSQIGAWAIRTACRQLRSWLDDGARPIRMAVNISHCQLTRGDLIGTVRQALQENALEAHLLELEISERGVLRRTAEILQLLEALKALGVRLSVDDFGTGESAIAYLKSLPVDVLKIDRSYIVGASTSHSDAAIASAIVAMAHRLDLRVVAEGIESDEQILNARNWGCDEFQGFLFSAARPPSEFRSLLATPARRAEPVAAAGADEAAPTVSEQSERTQVILPDPEESSHV